MARPQVAERRIGLQRLDPPDVDRPGVCAAARLAAHGDPARRVTAPLAEHDHGPHGEDVGDRRRLDVVGAEGAEVDPDLRENRGLDVLAELLGAGLGLFRLGDDERLAHPRARDAFDQESVDGGPDAEGEHVRAVKAAPDQLERVLLDVHVAVGGDDDRAGSALHTGQRQRPTERRNELGGASTLLALDEGDGAPDVLGGRRQRPLGHRRGAAREEQDVEGVGRP